MKDILRQGAPCVKVYIMSYRVWMEVRDGSGFVWVPVSQTFEHIESAATWAQQLNTDNPRIEEEDE